MDARTVTLAGIAVAAAVLLVVALRFGSRIRARFKAPGVDMSVDGSNDPAAAVVAENIVSRAGGVKATDLTGRGVRVRGIDARKDIEISASKAFGNDPKA